MYSFYIHLRKQAKGADSIFAPIFILADASSSQNVHKYLKFLYRKICCWYYLIITFHFELYLKFKQILHQGIIV